MTTTDEYLELAHIKFKEMQLAGMDPSENFSVCLKGGQMGESVWLTQVSKNPHSYIVSQGGPISLKEVLVRAKDTPEEAIAEWLQMTDI